jgi:peptidoglycan/LPS O-acetylase OafA/YrhL
VLLCHILPPMPKFIEYTPLRIFWAGHEAVVLFFILSGFVLSLPFAKNKKVKYDEFLIKRLFRIYVPYIIAVLFTLLLKSIFYSKEVAQKSSGATFYWSDDLGLKTLINHFLLVTNFNTNTLDPVVWSLVHEMRISIIFPLLMFLIIRLKWGQTIVLALMFSGVGMFLINNHIGESVGYLTSYAHTLHFTSFFMLGALISIHLEKIVNIFKGLSLSVKTLILFIGLCCYTLQIGLGRFISSNLLIHYSEWIMAIGASIFMIVAVSSKRISRILLLRPIKYFGKISFSLYLFHYPILMACLYALGNRLPIWQILIIMVVLAVIISTLSWYFVEENTIKWGRKIIGWKQTKQKNLRKIA